MTRLRTAPSAVLRLVLVLGVAGAGLAACTSGDSSPTGAAATAPATAPVTRPPATPASTLPASEQPATTAVPPPTKGNIHQHVHRGSVAVSSPVAFGRPASFSTTLSARAVRAVQFKARATRPGEISGPAVKVTVAITNHAEHAVSLGGVTVNCQDGAGTPLVSMESHPVRPLPTTLAAGRSATGLYVFELGAHWRNPLTFVLTNAATRSVVQFSGRVS